MPTLFIRTLMIYSLMFAVLRLMGKRQISEMQPFDFAVTLLIANLASIPMSEPAVPLFYGMVPIIGLFIVQRLMSYASLKSVRVRRLVCGNPLIIIEKGVVNESVMRSANYSLSDLTEQLRLKDAFSVSQVEYAILETNGSLSVLKKCPQQGCDDSGKGSEGAEADGANEAQSLQRAGGSNGSGGSNCSGGSGGRPALMLVADGKIDPAALESAELSRSGLAALLKSCGVRAEDCLFALLNDDGTLHIQRKAGKNGCSEAAVYDLNAVKRRAGLIGLSGGSGRDGQSGKRGKGRGEAEWK